jgi:hypothetical protein
MLKFKRETSGTSAIILLITEHTATDHIRRFFLKTSSRKMGPAQGVQMAGLTKFWRSGPTESMIFANSVSFEKSVFFLMWTLFIKKIVILHDNASLV